MEELQRVPADQLEAYQTAKRVKVYLYQYFIKLVPNTLCLCFLTGCDLDPDCLQAIPSNAHVQVSQSGAQARQGSPDNTGISMQ